MSKFHFEDRIEYRNKNDQKHHYYRPAVEYSNGIKEWWIDGLMYSFEAFIEFSHKKYDKWDEKTTWLDWKKKYHRVDGPAVKWDDGDHEWYRHGKLHREDGPASTMDGEKTWYINGKRHREDGPAVEGTTGYKEWWIKGKRHREDGPAIESSDGRKEWYRHGRLHREDGPAIKWSDGRKEWWLNGKRHREDGPAIEGADGRKDWWIKGAMIGSISNDDYMLVKKSSLQPISTSSEEAAATHEPSQTTEPSISRKIVDTAVACCMLMGGMLITPEQEQPDNDVEDFVETKVVERKEILDLVS